MPGKRAARPMPRVLSKEMGEEVGMPPGGEAEARRFYGQMLGLKETMRPPGEKGVWFRVPDAAGSDLFKVLPRVPFAPANREPQARFRVDKAEPMRMALDRARLRHYDAPPVEGTRGFYAHDPFGNRVELRERPGV